MNVNTQLQLPRPKKHNVAFRMFCKNVHIADNSLKSSLTVTGAQKIWETTLELYIPKIDRIENDGSIEQNIAYSQRINTEYRPMNIIQICFRSAVKNLQLN